jgi:putative transposase
MARLARLCIPGQLHHVLMRGVGGQAVFADAEDRDAFLVHLAQAARDHRLAVHAWALMPDHVHLLLTPADASGFSAGMQALGRSHTQAYNRRHGRRGTLWDGRYRSAVLQSDRWLLPAMVWLDSHPARSGFGAEPGSDHPWVSAGHYLGATTFRLVTVPTGYWALGNTPFAREAAYRTLLEQGCTQTETDALRKAALSGWVLGDAAFIAALQVGSDRRLAAVKPGRPRKQPAGPDPAAA